MSKKGKQFETAVYEFLKALTPNGIVHFDCKIPDRDTGRLRQVDAWIEMKLGNHIPLSVLISCKDYKRKLNISQIETFVSEINSTSASTGIIYSSSGFSESALLKAKAHGISCCQLFTKKPTSLPPKLHFHSYVCKPRIAIDINNDGKIKLFQEGIIYWDNLFELRVEKESTVLEKISQAYLEIEKEALLLDNLKNYLPIDRKGMLSFSDTVGKNNYFEIIIKVSWAIYKERAECHLFNGSYCFNTESYSGGMTGPVIDTLGFHPGPDWYEIEDRDKLPNANMVAIFKGPNITDTLLTNLKGKKIL